MSGSIFTSKYSGGPKYISECVSPKVHCNDPPACSDGMVFILETDHTKPYHVFFAV